MQENKVNYLKKYKEQLIKKGIIHLTKISDETFLLGCLISELTYDKFIEIVSQSNDWKIFNICSYMNDILNDTMSNSYLNILNEAKILIKYYKNLIEKILNNSANELELKTFELINNKNKQCNFIYLTAMNKKYLK